jgi:hypothetical protein
MTTDPEDPRHADEPVRAPENSPEVLPSADSRETSGAGAHPQRYVVRSREGEHFLSCVDAPEIGVTFGSSAVATEAAARKAPEGTIFVDGAAQAPPFIDPERQVFNLDHHVGCVRQFTVAACEQALILVLRGLDLSGLPWTIQATQPDLDALLAIWVLLNAPQIQAQEPETRRRLVAMVRLEGVIDVHGLGMSELSALAPEDLEAATEALEGLRQREMEMKSGGAWGSPESHQLITELLSAVDALVFPPGSLPEPVSFEVLARAKVDGGLVLACRSEQGVYEVESAMKQAYGRRLTILALETGPGRFTLRLVNPFHGGSLHAVYEELNTLDPAVARGGWRNSWGGSGEIGGSPRQSGTALKPQEVVDACKRALGKRSVVHRVGVVAGALGVTAMALLGALLGGWLAAGPLTFPLAPSQVLPFTVAFTALGAVLMVPLGLWHPGAFGLRRLVRGDWLYCLPAAIVVALAGGAWNLASTVGASPAEHLGTVLLLAAGAELTFRGAAHGLLGRGFRASHAGGKWYPSVPTVITALLYAGVGTLLPLAGSPFFEGGLFSLWPALAVVGFLFGLTLGLARERSGSILAPGVLHLGSAAACHFLAQLLP